MLSKDPGAKARARSLTAGRAFQPDISWEWLIGGIGRGTEPEEGAEGGEESFAFGVEGEVARGVVLPVLPGVRLADIFAVGVDVDVDVDFICWLRKSLI